MSDRGLRTVIGTSIMDLDDVHLGDITDTLIDFTEQRVVSFVVDWVMERRQVFGSSEDLPFTQVEDFLPHFVVVASEIGETAGLDLIPISEGDNLSANDDLMGRSVLDREGRLLGTLSDIYFDDEDGAIEGYEVLPEGETPHAWILPPSADLELTEKGMVISERDKEAMYAGRVRIHSRETMEQDEGIEEFTAAYPVPRTVHSEAYDLPGAVPFTTPPELNEEGLEYEQNLD